MTQHIRKTHDRNYSPPNKKIGRRLAPDPRSQPGLVATWPGNSEKGADEKKGGEPSVSPSNEMINVSQQHQQQTAQPQQVVLSHVQNSMAGLAVGTTEYHGIKVEQHMPNY